MLKTINHHWNRFIEMLLGDTRLAEFMSGLLVLGWGLFFLDPGGNTTISGLAKAMADVLPVLVWGLALTTLALAQMLGAAFGLKSARIAAAFFAAPFWGFLSLVIVISGSRVVSLLAYAAFAGICSWTYIRLANEGLKNLLQKRFAIWVRHRFNRFKQWLAARRGKRQA